MPASASARRPGGRPVRLAVLVALLAALVAGCGAIAGSGAGSSPIVLGAGGLDGQRAPAFRLDDLSGRPVSLSDYAGRPLIISFWASWCIPCQQEFPLFRQARAQYAARGLEVLGIVYQDTAANARAFMAREGATWPGLLDPKGTAADAYRVTAIPTSFFVDRAGTIVAASYGPPPADALAGYLKQIAG